MRRGEDVPGRDDGAPAVAGGRGHGQGGGLQVGQHQGLERELVGVRLLAVDDLVGHCRGVETADTLA